MWKTLTAIAISVLICVGLTAACKRGSNARGSSAMTDHIFSGPGGVAFDIAPELKTAPNTFIWPATYSENGHTAKFNIELVVPVASSSSDTISFGKGRFLAVPGSDPATFIAALQKALEAKQIPTAAQHVESLPFTYAILGTKQSRDKDGGFASTPSGSWIAMKIFLGSEEPDQGEVFLNLNAVNGQAEFSIKDPDYGDIVLRHLATIL